MKIIFPFLVLLLLLNSCIYHAGNPLRDAELQKLTISEITNLTAESSLTPLFKNALLERIANEPGLQLATGSSDQAGELRLTIRNLDNRSLARAKLREEEDVDYDGDAYQTVLYRIRVNVEYEVHSLSSPGKVLCSGRVSGQADLAKLHDREIALRTALRQLAMDLAAALVSELTETR